MIIFGVILILAAPLAGLYIGRLARLSLADASPVARRWAMVVYAGSALGWLPFAFLSVSGFARFTFLTAMALMYLTIIDSVMSGRVCG